MSARTLCPNLEQPCEDCVADFVFDHPGVEVRKHTLHLLCDCPWVADDGQDDICVGCGEKRDLWAEFWRGMRGAA